MPPMLWSSATARRLAAVAAVVCAAMLCGAPPAPAAARQPRDRATSKAVMLCAGTAPRGGPACPTARAAGAGLSWLHQSGMQLLDASGRSVQLTGFDEGGMYDGQGNGHDACDRYWVPPDPAMGPQIHAWGFNSVRLFIAWANLEPTPPTLNPDGTLTHHWNMQYVEALDRIVAQLGSSHVYLIPVMVAAGLSPAFKSSPAEGCEGAGMPAWLFPGAASETARDGWCDFLSDVRPPGVPVRTLDGFAAAWQFIARRYAQNPTVVAADLINEPAHDLVCRAGLRPGRLDELNHRIGTAVRAVNPNIVLVLEGENHSYGYPSGITTAGLTNLMYTWHNYPKTWAQGRSAFEAALGEARKLDAPLWLGEFDPFNADDNVNPPTNPNWRSDFPAMMRFLRDNRVNWAFENYSGQWSITIPGTNDPKADLLTMLRQGVVSGQSPG